jgi:transporter family protein
LESFLLVLSGYNASPMLGVIFAISSLALWSIWAFLPKLALQSLSPRKAFTAEVLGGVLFGLVLLAVVSGIHVYPISSFYAITGGVCSYVGVLLYVFLLRSNDVGYLATITGLYPAVTVLLAGAVLGDHISSMQAVGVIVALLSGVLISAGSSSSREDSFHLHSEADEDHKSAVTTTVASAPATGRFMHVGAVVAMLLLWGVWGVLPKAALKHLQPSDILLYEVVGAILMLIVFLPTSLGRLAQTDPKSPTPTNKLWFEPARLFAGLAGVCAFGGMFMYAKAVTRLETSIVVTLTGMYPVGTFVLAIIVLHERVTRSRAYGLLLAVVAIWLLTS